MKLIPALLGFVLTAGPAVAGPALKFPPLPYCGSGDPGFLVGTCRQRPVDPVFEAQIAAEQQARRQAYLAEQAAKDAEAREYLANAPLRAVLPSVGGSVYVRSHQRCNSSKCWSVRAYTRRR